MRDPSEEMARTYHRRVSISPRPRSTEEAWLSIKIKWNKEQPELIRLFPPRCRFSRFVYPLTKEKSLKNKWVAEPVTDFRYDAGRNVPLNPNEEEGI
jgi:hypothetical protein